MGIFFARQTHLDTLADEIREVAARDDLPFEHAAERIIALKFGYDLDEVQFVDGAGDRGIDFWYASNGGLYVYQVKTHYQTEYGQLNINTPFDSKGVSDLMRAKNFLLGNTVVDEDHRLATLKNHFKRLIRDHESRGSDNPLHVFLTLVILGEKLTDQALEELADFEAKYQRPALYDNVPVAFHVDLQTIDDILRSAWHEENRAWIDVKGNKRDSILLTPLRQSDKRHYLNDNKSAIFYCRALDLVTAYEDFGYQIFEPNVRANIKNSKINNAIQESASFHRSMKEFRFLNNGLTIICKNYRLPSGQRSAFDVQEPGIVNGLQTVMSLYRAYHALSEPEDKQSFEEDCYVLVRLLRHDGVHQITDVVLATNNQNPMQPRNLVSNSTEQTHFARFFAERLGWFYEAKQGAWDAFRKEPDRWRPRIDRPASAFKAKKGYKTIDNLDLAQDWLAFLGFASRAANDKRNLFDKGYYDLIFLRRTRSHAYLNYNSIQDAVDDSISESPDAHLMLVAHLARLFASEVVPSTQTNKKAALERQGILDRETISTAEEEKILYDDAEYILNQALISMSLVFVEFVGFTLFKVFAEDAHRCGRLILKNHSWNILATKYDLESVTSKAKGIDKNLADDDLLIIMWLFFREAVQTMMSGPWQTAYINARYKPRFILNNRGQIYQETLTMDEVLKRRVPLRIYTNGIVEGEGFFGYIERVIANLLASN